MFGREVLPVAVVLKDAITDKVSVEDVDKNESVATAEEDVAVSLVNCVTAAEDTLRESLYEVALEGTTDKRPKPNAATVTSATRLNVVFVDICFLSFVVIESFPTAAWNERVIPSRCIARADASNSPPCIRTR